MNFKKYIWYDEINFTDEFLNWFQNLGYDIHIEVPSFYSAIIIVHKYCDFDENDFIKNSPFDLSDIIFEYQ